MWHPQILGHLECRPKIYYDIWSMAINSSKLSSFGIPVIPIKPNISVWNPFNNPYNRVLCWVLTEIPTNRQYFWGIILLKSPGNSEFQRFLASLQLLCGAGLVPSAVTFNTGAQGFCSGRPHVGSWSYLMFRYCIIREHHGSHQFFVSSQLLLLFVAQKPRLPILSSSYPCETPRTWTHGAMPSRPCSVREAAKTMVLASLYADAGRNPSLF